MASREFTTDWFSTAIDGIQRTMKCTGVNVRKILEIGSWEGRSATWFLETYPDASIVCVDTFRGSEEHAGLDVDAVKRRFLNNTEIFGERVVLREGESSKVLFGLQPESFDVVYVDGSHAEHDVLMDLVMAFGLLKEGGVMLVDDYAHPEFYGVTAAVHAFVRAFASSPVKPLVVLDEYQIHLLKTK